MVYFWTHRYSLAVWPHLTFEEVLHVPMNLLALFLLLSKTISSHTEGKSVSFDPLSLLPHIGSPQTKIKTIESITILKKKEQVGPITTSYVASLCSSPASLVNCHGALICFAFSLFALSGLSRSMLR